MSPTITVTDQDDEPDTDGRVPGRRMSLPGDPEDMLIDEACRELRLPAFRERFIDLAGTARREQATYKQFLLDMLQAELTDRDLRRQQRLLRLARFPRPKRLELSGVHLCPSGTSVSVGFTRSDGRWRCAIRS
ncbi:ATP-binding protein [Streptomyces sp. NPDC127106]|uniref:ATP-binding protein n=1 Tax=Streptomyces sp. NPDC127106 TaxID=3345360 RepID=UPI00363440A4